MTTESTTYDPMTSVPAESQAIAVQDDNKIHSLYIGNLPLTIDEDGLRNLFGQFNPGEVRVKQDTTAAGNPRRYGFVEVTGRQTVDDAIQTLDQFEVDGHRIYVSLSNKSGDYVHGGPKRNDNRAYSLTRSRHKPEPQYPPPQQAPSKYKTQICRFNLEGKCQYGNDCNFIHTDPNQPQQQQYNPASTLQTNPLILPSVALNLGLPNLLSDPASSLLFSPLLNIPGLSNLSSFNPLSVPLTTTLPTTNVAPDLNSLLNSNSLASLSQSLNTINNPGLTTNSLLNLYNPQQQLQLQQQQQQQSLQIQGADRGYDSRGPSNYRGTRDVGRESHQGGYPKRGPTGGPAEKYKTAPCRLWAAGECKFGDGCSFIHGNERAGGQGQYARQPPRLPTAPMSANNNPNFQHNAPSSADSNTDSTYNDGGYPL